MHPAWSSANLTWVWIDRNPYRIPNVATQGVTRCPCTLITTISYSVLCPNGFFRFSDKSPTVAMQRTAYHRKLVALIRFDIAHTCVEKAVQSNARLSVSHARGCENRGCAKCYQ